MADSINPTGNDSSSSNFLPKFYQTDSNKKFLQATVDQLIQPGTVKKVNGYVGQQNAKASTGDDIFIKAPTAIRQNYQLEPGLTVKDELDNTTFFKDYQDFINQISVFGGDTRHLAHLSNQEFYSWDPHICWDKFVNFQNYYWLPYGPETIAIAGQQQAIQSTFTVKIESELDNNVYLFTPGGLVRNPTIKLYKGQTYTFEIDSPGNPFSIKTERVDGTQGRYVSVGLSDNAVEKGSITFTVPHNAPDVLFYVSESDVDLGGAIEILPITENTKIDVESEILGKKFYKLPDGTELSNGMKVMFVGKVSPAQYETGRYYVAGVGNAIKLIDEHVLELISTYTLSETQLFDSIPFDTSPFSDATAIAGQPDYVVIDRGSADHNPWSRYNRWIHKDVIEASAKVNGKIAEIDQSARATRPIIEFGPGLKLFNFGRIAIANVDVIDTYTTDAFSTIEGQLGYNIDGIDLVDGHRVIFAADTDILVKNNVYKVNFLTLEGVRRIHLTLEETPVADHVVLVKTGVKNQGQMYWFDGSNWTLGQQKTALNQAPLFDVVDENGISFGDRSTYEGSTFTGTKLFSYKVGTGTDDTTLGFPLSYKNINNVGDIVFNFDLALDSFQYRVLTDVITKNTNVGYLVQTDFNNQIQYVNGWQVCSTKTLQAAVRIYKNSTQVNNFDIDIFDNIDDLTDLIVRVYVNGIRLDSASWSIVDGIVYKSVVLDTDISLTDVLTIRAFSSQAINNNGFYEIPVSLQNNPLNETLGDFTLGEVIDHVNSIVDNLPNFSGSFPGPSNLRDLGNITQYGTKFVQHSGPMSLSLYHMTSEDNNIIRAIEKARDDYGKFKRNFIAVAETLGVDGEPAVLVDLILQKINKDKPKTAPYYFSDMAPYGACTKTEIKILDPRIKSYPLSSAFTLTELSEKSVLLYLNGEQLLKEHDYDFDGLGFVVLTNRPVMSEDDTLVIYEYENSNGCFIPPTPTKLGIWPSSDPKIYVDTSFLTPRTMIQGHDGSQVLAYDDYRDDLILELEKRIYNNIKVSYNPDIFDIYDILPGYGRETDYTLTEFNQILAPQFYKWTTLIDRDFTKPLSYDRNNPLTFNYKGHAAPDGRETPGYWRGVYRWMLDTDKPNTAPWEMLGFSDEPLWWQEVYGPAPYTSNNIPMWKDLSDGMIREPGKPPVKRSKFARPFLIDHIPVDSQGNVISPLASGLSNGIITTSTSSDFVFGDVSPVEATWRRSSYFPFGVLVAALLMYPNKTFGTLLDRSRVVRNAAGQLIYKDTGLRITPDSIKLPSIYSSETNVQTSGIINYIVDYILSDNLKSYTQYQYNLKNLTANLSYRVAGFTSKEKFKLLLDSKTPLSQGSVFVPPENYDIILNSSSPIKKITYSGVIITRTEVPYASSTGYEVKGYSKTQPYFKYYPWVQSGVKINIGGISEGFSVWTPNQQYAAGKVVELNGKYYRVKALHTTKTSFESAYYESLPELPISGGREAFLRKEYDRTNPVIIPYGFKFRTIQEVVDFLLGYGEYLKDEGFIFDEYNSALNAVTNWETSAKEFLFWTTQNWSTGQDKWQEWIPMQQVSFGSIVRYNGDYYRAIRTIEPSDIFNLDDYVKLDGLSTVGSSVISLSPSAAKLTFSTTLSVVDDIRNSFNDYEIFKVDGTTIEPNFLNSYRKDNAVSYTPSGDAGIYGASFYLVQKEQVIVLNNTTMFNDTIYNPASGYRQQRIKVSGYVNTDWKGSFDVPGFIFDQATIQLWENWKDYNLGCIVKYKEFYYSAKTFLAGTEKFNANDWVKLDKKPEAQMLPNWTYKASQFTDFYSLDSDNFDAGQQAVAQHLIGYQKRQYLSNIIKDDVSEYKFYQGMIVEKGTQNVLNKLFDVLSADNQESLKFNEEWALRVGQYGASAAYENVEFILDESLFKNNPQGFELVDKVDSSKVDFIIRQTPSDVYLKPIGYTNNLWPTLGSRNAYLRTPGYARPDEMRFVLSSLEEIVNQDISVIKSGDYVWVGFENREWNIYRYTDANLKVKDVVYSGTTLTITMQDLVELNAGEYVGISQVDSISGFYKIESVHLDTITINVELATIPESPFTQQAEMLMFVFVPQRATNKYDNNDNLVEYAIDRAWEFLPATLKDGELLWTDDNGSGKWAVWKYSPVYSKLELTNDAPIEDLQYGKAIAVNSKSSILAISNAKGDVEIYDSASVSVPWLHRQTILNPVFTAALAWNDGNIYSAGAVVFVGNAYYIALSAISAGIDPTNETNRNVWSKLYSGEDVGTSLAVSGDGRWLAVGTPNAGYVSVENIPGVYTRATLNGTVTQFVNRGVISLYEKDSNNIFTLIDTIVSPNAANGELFGSSLAFGDNVLFVGAPGSSTGAVYSLAYSTQTVVSKSFNPTGSSGTTVVLSNTSGIIPGMAVKGIGFTDGQLVTQVVDDTTITVSEAPSTTPVGTLSFTLTMWRYTDDMFAGTTPDGQFGASVSVTKDNKTVVVAAPGKFTGYSPVPGEVFVYRASTTGYVEYGSTLISAIGVSVQDQQKFGNSIAITDTGDYIALSATLVDKSERDQGTVFLYNDTGTGYEVYQELNNNNPEQMEMFGSKVAFMPESSTLVVYSRNADSLVYDTFDTYSSLLSNATEIYGTPYVNDPTSQLSNSSTTFDLNLTTSATRNTDGGRVDVFDKYNNKWIFSESLPSNSTIDAGYGAAISASNNTIFVSAPYAIDKYHRSGKVFRYRKPVGQYSWSVLHGESEKTDATKIKQAFLYNKLTNKLVSYLDVIDPAQGKIPGIADQEIKYKTFYDPATYSVGTVDVNVDDGMAWAKPQVGMLWWDLRTAKFYDSYDNDVVYRNSTWNTLFPGASIDVYEWVETAYKPSQWNDLADTEAGLAKGISGSALYGDTVYSVVQKYDNVAKVFKNTYYFWVKNKTTIPNVANRFMSARDVASLIENPRGQGYKYLALTGANTFSLVNVKSLLDDKNVVLSVEYWTVDNTDQNIHTQWKLVSTDDTTKLPATIEQKWFDSLCGKDLYDRPVPDLTLPVKVRYGIENRPRQGMFINRVEALKQLIEHTNRVLVSQVIEDTALTKLQAYDAEPSIKSGLYDVVMDTDAELRFANIGTFRQASITPIITNGRITGVNIDNAGFGYVTAPTITVVGDGESAMLTSVINVKGQITGVTVNASGSGYTTRNTYLLVRSYSVLVHADSQASNIWSIYSYDALTATWSRVRSQTYDTRRYWSYIDWYATGYNQFTSPDYAVNTFVDLNTISVNIGELVKIRTNSAGNWLLLRKYANTQSIDWTQQYDVIGIQNGTIQFNDGLYNFSNSIYGYDGSLYDGSIFDNSASIELRNILTTIRDSIFVDDLRQEYLNLFFNSIRYVLSEQTYVDWIFKTSFIKAQHNVGELKEKVTYNNDNLADFESYVAEVKPYRTKIREYVSSYSKVENSQSAVTDFDLLPVFDASGPVPITTAVIDGEIVADNNAITQYPWKFWYDNLGFKVTELRLVDGGSGYRSEPVVRIENATGSGATARAFIANGKVNRIVLITSGSGYLSAPTVIVDGGLSDGGTPARVVAVIGDSVIRTNFIKVKFDRTTHSYYITQLDVTETFVGTNSKVQFPLIWGPNVLIGQSSVTIDGTPVLRDSYKLIVVKSTKKGYTSYSGSIIFDEPPAADANIVVKYIKDWSLLNAADRIQYYYNPQAGDIGKDLSQLMTGVDYGGVIVNGLDFNIGAGWDSVPYYTDKWGTLDETFDDYIVTVDANTHSLRLPYVPTTGTEINVYYVSKYSQSYTSDGSNLYYTFDVYATFPPKVTASISKTVSGITASGVEVVRDVYGNLTSTLTVNDTAGIVAGMAVVGTGFESKQKVKTVIDDTTIVLTAEPNTLPDSTLFFTVNASGLDILTVDSTTGVKVGDIVTITPYIQGTIGYNTAVTAIINDTQVRLERIMFNSIPEAATVTFTRTLVNPVDYRITQAGELYLKTALAVDTEINISSSYAPVRIDDPNLGTPNQSQYAAMLPIIGDSVNYGPEDPNGGITVPVIIPAEFVVNAGDGFILRKSTSDGSVAVQESDYDTAITGGDLAYSSATGLRADDIIIDGDDFVTPTSSPAPEEVVPGQVVDAVAIKVYETPSSGSANIIVENFQANGTTTDFVLAQYPNSNQAIVVKVTDGSTLPSAAPGATETVIATRDVDYTFDYRTKTVKFNVAPLDKRVVTVFNIGFNGSNILAMDYFIGDGVTTEFVTHAPWTETLSYLLYVDGNPALNMTPVLFKTDSSYESSNMVGIRFSVAPEANAIIHFVIVDSTQQTYAVTKTEKIVTDGRTDPAGTSTYNLQNTIGNSLPIESSMIVRVDQDVLKGPSDTNFKISGAKFNYAIDTTKVEPYTLSITDLVVIAGGDLLHVGIDYTVDMSGIIVKLNKPVAKAYSGKTLTVSIRRDSGYLYVPASGSQSAKIVFAQSYGVGRTVEVISSYKHDILDIQRTDVSVSTNVELTTDTLQFYDFNNIKGGIIKLDRTVINDNFVWVVKNTTLLTPTVDYKVNYDKQSITLASIPSLTDRYTMITFSSNVIGTGVSYMQFKDMLNRVHYKRLSLNKQTRLVKQLKYTDKDIEVADASNFDVPNPAVNRPGIVEIRGERIEFYSLTTVVHNEGEANEYNTYVLSQLHRGTLGTGVASIYDVDTIVQEIGSSETIPYTDTIMSETVVSDGTDVIPLPYAPMKAEIATGYVATTPADWIKEGLTTSVASGNIQADDIEVFANGQRLKKKPYKMYSNAVHPDSPEGDIPVETGFYVDGITSQLTLTTPVAFGTSVLVVKKTGTDWDGKVSSSVLEDTSKVGKFIRAEPGISYVEYKKTAPAGTFDSVATTFDGSNTTFDQG